MVPDRIEKELPGHCAIHLAVSGRQSLYTLIDLAEDPGFKGIVIFSMIPSSLHADNVNAAKPWVRYYHDHFDKIGNLSQKYNARIQARLQEKFAIMSTSLRLKTILLSGFSPKPTYVHMGQDRFRAAGYHTLMTPGELTAHRLKRMKRLKYPTDSTRIDHEGMFSKLDYDTLMYCYRKLRDKGAHLVLVRMPSTGEHWRYDQRYYPKEKFWDQIVQRSGIPAIHFKEYKELSSFECLDTSHLDATDSPVFTENLIRIINQKYGRQLRTP